MGNSFFDGLKDSFEIDFYMTGLRNQCTNVSA